MTADWPWWFLLLLLAMRYWPITVGIGVSLLITAKLLRGWLRWAALAAVVPFVAVAIIAAGWAVNALRSHDETATFYAKTQEVLDHEEMVDGVKLLMGTAVQWRDVNRRQLSTASPPTPIELFGLQVRWVELSEDKQEWSLQLARPQAIEGWTCDENGVRVSPGGRLRSCELTAGRIWQGWPIPAKTFLDLSGPGKVKLALAQGASMAAPEIGHIITATGSFTLNTDGSLDQLTFDGDDPLIAKGHRLFNTVEWSYDPSTYGQGRRRQAVTVAGSEKTENGGFSKDVIIRMADGQASPAL